jgi:hypothetical protein
MTFSFLNASQIKIILTIADIKNTSFAILIELKGEIEMIIRIHTSIQYLVIGY